MIMAVRCFQELNKLTPLISVVTATVETSSPKWLLTMLVCLRQKAQSCNEHILYLPLVLCCSLRSSISMWANIQIHMYGYMYSGKWESSETLISSCTCKHSLPSPHLFLSVTLLCHLSFMPITSLLHYTHYMSLSCQHSSKHWTLLTQKKISELALHLIFHHLIVV